MPDGNVPSARIPTPSDDQSRSSPTPDEARAPSSRESSPSASTPLPPAKAPRAQNTVPRTGALRRITTAPKTPPTPAPAPTPVDRLTRLDTLRKQLIEARSSTLPLTELLQTYDKELFAIKQETEKNGGLSPLTYKEQEELRRLEEEREALANTREDDPRARARALAEQIKRLGIHKTSANVNAALEARREQTENAQTSAESVPTAHDIEMLRSELNILKNEAWQNNLTRELNRNQGATVDDLEKALEQAERAVRVQAASTPKAEPAPLPSISTVPISSTEETPSSSETRGDDEDLSLVSPAPLPEHESTLSLDEQKQHINALEAATQAHLAQIQTTSEAVAQTLAALEQAPEIRIAGRFSSEEERAHVDELHRELRVRQAHLLEALSAVHDAKGAIDTLSDTDRAELLQKLDATYQEQIASNHEDQRLRERLADIEERYTQLATWLKQGSVPTQGEAYFRAIAPLQALQELSPPIQEPAPLTTAEQPTPPQPVATPLETQTPTPPPGERTQTAATEPLQSSVAAAVDATIAEARTELKAKYAARLHEQEVVKLYQERIRERSWAYLQTQSPAQFQHLQSMQVQLNIEIDPSVTFAQQALETVHLQAVQDIRLRFPEVTDALLSTLLLNQAKAQLAGSAALQAGMSATALQHAVEGAAIAGAAIGAGAIAASVTGAGLLTAFAKQQEATDRLAQELAHEEQQSIQRAAAVKTIATSPDQGTPILSERSPDGEQLRLAQRASVGKRRGLQAKLNVGLRQLQAWNSAIAAGTSGTGTSLTPEALGALAVVSPNMFRVASAPASPIVVQSPANDTSDLLEFDETTQRMRQTRDRLSRQQEETTQDSLSTTQHEHAKAAHLQSLKARAKTAPLSVNQLSNHSASPTTTTPVDTSDQPPLFALSTAPKTREEAFARRQSLMNRERDQFLGLGSEGGGYEVVFGLTGSAQASDATEDSDDLADEASADQSLDGDEQNLIDEQARQAEFLRQQQLAAQQREQEEGEQRQSLVNGQNAQRLQQAAKLLRGAGTATVGTVLAAALVVVLIIWLNIRLFFPDPDSSWRKPLGPFGKIGTVGLDFLLFTLSILQFLVWIAILLLPLIIIVLPGAIIAATLIRAIGL